MFFTPADQLLTFHLLRCADPHEELLLLRHRQLHFEETRGYVHLRLLDAHILGAPEFLGCGIVVLVFLLDLHQGYFVVAFGPAEEVFERGIVHVVPTHVHAGALVGVEADTLLLEIHACLHARHAFEALGDVLDFPEFVVEEGVRIVFHSVCCEPLRVLIRYFEHTRLHDVEQVVLRHDLLVDLV